MDKNIIYFCMIIMGIFSTTLSHSASDDKPYVGCNCTALKACKVGACALMTLGCIFSNDANWAAVKMCKDGGMKHCKNWDKVLSYCK